MNDRQQVLALLTEGARPHNLDLRNVNLSAADLGSLHADALDMREANLCGIILRHAHFTHCRLDGVHLEDADCSGAVLRMCVLDGVRGAGARFQGARIEDGSAIGADLSHAVLRRARLSETTFTRAVLREAVLDGAEGTGVELRGADLRGASFVGADLGDADFRGADLTGADLSHGRFNHADFRGALLDGVRWEGANLSNAEFDARAFPVQSAQRGDEATPSSEAAQAAASLVDGIREVLRSAASDQNGMPAETGGIFAGACRTFVAQAAEPAPDKIRSLVDGLQRSFVERDIDMPELANLLDPLLRALDAPGDEPPEALKPLIDAALLAVKRGSVRQS